MRLFLPMQSSTYNEATVFGESSTSIVRREDQVRGGAAAAAAGPCATAGVETDTWATRSRTWRTRRTTAS